MIKLCIFIVIAIIAYTYAAVAIYPYEPKPAEFADQEGCYIRDLNRVLRYNTPYHPKDGKSCLQYTCGTNNQTQLVSCGAVGFPPNCYLKRDYTLDYPKCCGTVVCNTTTTTSTTTTEPPTITSTTTTEPPTIISTTTTKPPTITSPATTEPPTITSTTITEPPTITSTTTTEPPTITSTTTTERPTEETCITVTTEPPPCEHQNQSTRTLTEECCVGEQPVQ